MFCTVPRPSFPPTLQDSLQAMQEGHPPHPASLTPAATFLGGTLLLELAPRPWSRNRSILHRVNQLWPSMEGCRQSRIFVQCESKKSSGSPTVEPWCSGDAKLQIAHLAAATCQYVPDPQNATKGLESLDVLRSGQIPLATLTLKTLLYLSSWSAGPMSQPTVMRAAGIPITSRKSTIRTGRNNWSHWAI